MDSDFCNNELEVYVVAKVVVKKLLRMAQFLEHRMGGMFQPLDMELATFDVAVQNPRKPIGQG